MQNGTNARNSYSGTLFAAGVRVCSVPLRDRARRVVDVFLLRLLTGLSGGVFHSSDSMARPSSAQQPGTLHPITYHQNTLLYNSATITLQQEHTLHFRYD